MDDKPASALRKKRDSSIARAAELVSENKADAMVSLGNTGGIFAAATLKVGRIAGWIAAALRRLFPGREANLCCSTRARMSSASRSISPSLP